MTLQVIKAEDVRDGEPRWWCADDEYATEVLSWISVRHLHDGSHIDEFAACHFAIVDRPAPTPAPGLDLDAVERAERAMTPGPWRMHGYAAEIVDADDETVARLDMRGDRITGGDARGFSDAAGIVALRNSAPALIAEVRALRARLAEAKRLGLEFVALHREAGNCDGWGPFPEMRSKRMAAIAAALEAL